ncbi:MAG: glycosyltransferase [Actinomycetota bacterium]|nr:glycosyltransferase [Actinomycetota bacterium]
MTPIPITFVSSHSANGGSERYLDRLLSELGSAWIHSVICLEGGPLVEKLRSEGIDVSVIPVAARPPGSLIGCWRLRRHLNNTGASLIHANGIKAAFACGLATTFTPAKLIWVKHDFSFEGWFASTVGAMSDKIIGVSTASISSLRGLARGKAVTVHTGIEHVDLDRARSRSRLLAETGWPQDSVIIGSVGRLHPVKGFAELIAATSSIRERVPQARVAIVGSPDPHYPHARENLEAIARSKDFYDHVSILGERDDVRTVMAAFDIGVIPTIAVRRGGREGFSLVALEMLDAGTPVVAFRSGALPEVLGDCGMLADEGNVQALGDSIVRVAEDDAIRRRLASCGPERVARAFSTSRWVAAMKEEYVATWRE